MQTQIAIKKRQALLDFILWPALYFAFVIPYLLVLHRIGEPSLLDAFPLIGLSPLLLLIIATIVERVHPFNANWNKPDMQTVNNILYMVTSNYSEIAGKSIALFLAPVMVSHLAPGYEAQSIWLSSFPVAIQVAVGVLLYDFVYYWYHRFSHFLAPLWRLHRLHHATEKLNALVLSRFNVLDIIIELFLLTSVMYWVGLPEKIYLIMTAFMIPATVLSHANFEARLPRFLEWIVITPTTHRIHHSKDKTLLNRNFGGFTLFWDVVFKTYEPSGKNEINEIGISNHHISRWFWGQLFDFLKK